MDGYTRVIATLETILACRPAPGEILIHIDQPDDDLAPLLTARFPSIRVLTSPKRLGPGGGRHRCLRACTSPIAVSFDDDSYPLDVDFFRRVVALFETHCDAALLAARVWQRGDVVGPREPRLRRAKSYVGCGYAVRVEDYLRTRGHVSRSVPYGMEETDLAIMLFAAGRRVYESWDLRVFHDSDLAHHRRADITQGIIANVALFAFIHYPLSLCIRGLLQVANAAFFCLKSGRWKGLLAGLAGIPADCWQHRRLRSPLPSSVVHEFLEMGR